MESVRYGANTYLNPNSPIILNNPSRLRARLHFGLGIQWQHGTHRASTLQLGIGSRVLIFHLAKVEFAPVLLAYLLADPRMDFYTFLPPHVVRRFLANAGE
ncbi:hypothetical protein L195_g055767 [Trifolium pratense]|uniref:Uncharacterized protein n=1 Tax=Trifolium pratense TaxID=57577 RepID=A0A2K3KN87_TRIPR|nr:hypothetical protein L195_g055767 [Trifolium pratense]